VYYVSSLTGTDAADRGRSRASPLASLAYCLDTFIQNSLSVVLMSGHSEVMAGARIISSLGVSILGEGEGDDIPSLSPYGDTSPSSMLVMNGTGIVVSNVKFLPSFVVYPSATNKLVCNSNHLLLEDCVFEQGDNDSGGNYRAVGLSCGAAERTNVTLVNCSFVKTAEYATSAVGAGIWSYAGKGSFTMIGCSFDGGVTGWDPRAGFSSSFAGMFAYGTLFQNTLRSIDTEFLNGASFSINTSTLCSIVMKPGSSDGVVLS
jgi:hypothetical protein